MFGYINLMRAAYANMAARGQGVIVNVLGTAGKEVPGRYVAGVSGNAALAALAAALGGVSLDARVRVVGISPGDVINEHGILFPRRQVEASLDNPERWREMLKDQPGGRGVYEDDIADAVLFLASSRAAYISGVNVPVDGGLQTRERVL